MSRRLKVPEVTKKLSALVKMGAIDSKSASGAAMAWMNGDDTPLRNIIYNPLIPMSLMSVCAELKEYLGGN